MGLLLQAIVQYRAKVISLVLLVVVQKYYGIEILLSFIYTTIVYNS